MSEDIKNKKENEKKVEAIEMKAILLGNSGVGKTNLINTCVGLQFDEGTNPSSTGSFVQKLIKTDNKNYLLNLWDTAGQEVYKSITKIFLKKSELVIFVYDITDKKSFDNLEYWITMSKEMIDNDFISAIVGNKMDLYMIEQVKEEEARKYAESKGMQFQLVSAKDNPKGFTIFLKELLEGTEGLSKTEILKEIININNDDNKVKKPCLC